MSTLLGIALGVLLILALTAATGYFVAQEFAYVAVDRNALRQLADDGDAAAETMDHHPDIDIRWRTVSFALSTHSAGGLTQLDIELAHQISQEAARRDAPSAG